MTIILVFLLKSMSASTRVNPAVEGPDVPKSILTTEASQEGLAVLISKSPTSWSTTTPSARSRPTRATASRPATRRAARTIPVITPLENAPSQWRERDRQLRDRHGEGPELVRGDHHRRQGDAVSPALRGPFHARADGVLEIPPHGHAGARSPEKSDSSSALAQRLSTPPTRSVRLLLYRSLVRGRRFSLHPFRVQGVDEAC